MGLLNALQDEPGNALLGFFRCVMSYLKPDFRVILGVLLLQPQTALGNLPDSAPLPRYDTEHFAYALLRRGIARPSN